MTTASPEDLAVAFRSFERRLREAQGAAADALVASTKSAIDQQVAGAARLLRCAATLDAIAAAIAHRPADSWGDADLDGLQSAALRIGALIRQVEQLAGGGED